MGLLIRAGCVLAVLCFVTAQTDEELDRLIAQLYPEPEGSTTTKNPHSTAEPVDGTGNCTCVPYYLCKVIDRAREGLCDNYFEACCISVNKDGSGLIDKKISDTLYVFS